jgi:molecular chaperone GrpE
MIEAVLADFRSWLQAAAAAGANGQPASSVAGPGEEPIDLHTLLGQMVALRHEVNLQTRAVRAQQEQNAETLRQFGEALDSRRSTPAAEADLQPGDDSVRPLLQTLVELHDAAARAQAELERVQALIREELLAPTDLPSEMSQAMDQVEAVLTAPPSFWSRWFGGGRRRRAEVQQALDRLTQERQQLEAQAQQQQQFRARIDTVLDMLDSLVTGFGMSMTRVERALHYHGLEPIAAVGQRFDPEQMEVVEVVTGSDHPAGEVIEEVGRGYRWHGRPFRFAQVRVAK